MKKSIGLLLMVPFLLGLVTVSSCKKVKVTDEVIPGFSMSRIFYIAYVNPNGTNLLQNDSQIGVFYLKDGIAQRVVRSNLDYPNGFTITSQRNTGPNGSDELCVKVFPSDYYNNENISTSYIKLGDHQMDTIQCKFYSTTNSISLTKIWLNGSLVWDIETDKTTPFLQLIK